MGVIADGPGDIESLKRRFEGLKVVKAVGPRGHSVSPEALAAGAAKQIAQMVNLGFSSIVLMTDREGRTESASGVAKKIVAALAPMPGAERVRVIIADRMIENWYLADIEQLSAKRAYVRDGLKQKKYEGTHGKNVLKDLLVKNHGYSEVRDGPQLFETIRLAIAANNSASFATLTTMLRLEGIIS